MTKNKAMKRAARERSAVTGERYVVARRATEHAQLHRGRDAGTGDGLLHRLTHRVPGVPAHVEGGLVARRNRPHGQRARIHPPHAARAQANPRRGEPRVLIAWQHRIARLLHAE